MNATSKLSQRIVNVNSILVSCFLCLALSLLSGCGKSVVGRWTLDEGQSTYGVIEEMELLKDGSGIVDRMGITWKTERGRIYFTASLQAQAWDYKISGKTLTLTDNNGESRTYSKYKPGQSKPQADEEWVEPSRSWARFRYDWARFLTEAAKMTWGAILWLLEWNLVVATLIIIIIVLLSVYLVVRFVYPAIRVAIAKLFAVANFNRKEPKNSQAVQGEEQSPPQT